MAPRPTISITLPAPLIKQITKLAKQRGLTRSALISLVLTDYVRDVNNARKEPDGS